MISEITSHDITHLTLYWHRCDFRIYFSCYNAFNTLLYCTWWFQTRFFFAKPMYKLCDPRNLCFLSTSRTPLYELLFIAEDTYITKDVQQMSSVARISWRLFSAKNTRMSSFKLYDSLSAWFSNPCQMVSVGQTRRANLVWTVSDMAVYWAPGSTRIEVAAVLWQMGIICGYYLY